jgi:RND family efflux transporter MFP subunit
LEGAKQMRNEVMAQFNYANITAPFSGTVTNTFIKEGDMANPGMPLVSVEGVSKLQVTAMVSESDISNIKNGMPVNVIIKSMNKKVSGKVSEVSSSAKNTGGQYLVKVTLDKMDALILSGMFVNVQFPIEKQTATTPISEQVLVPETALIRQGQLTGVYTIANNTAILRWLRIGKTYGDKVEVLSGLKADEPYIISSEGKLFNGAKVQTN